VKEAQQKRLEELKKEMEEHDRRDREKKFAKKYHKVKFFGARISPAARPSLLRPHARSVLRPRSAADWAERANSPAAERVKVERRIGKIERHEKDGEMTDELHAELKALKEDLEYVKVGSPSPSHCALQTLSPACGVEAGLRRTAEAAGAEGRPFTWSPGSCDEMRQRTNT